jgi:small subunit ribosomal protein S19e
MKNILGNSTIDCLKCDLNAVVLGKALAKKLNSQLSFNFNPCMFKSGACSERLPTEPNWFMIRAVSLLKVLWSNPIGIKKLQKRYGKMRSRGSAPSKKYSASGFLLRHLIQELERVGYLGNTFKGRYTTQKAKDMLFEAHSILS